MQVLFCSKQNGFIATTLHAVDFLFLRVFARVVFFLLNSIANSRFISSTVDWDYYFTAELERPIGVGSYGVNSWTQSHACGFAGGKHLNPAPDQSAAGSVLYLHNKRTPEALSNISRGGRGVGRWVVGGG